MNFEGVDHERRTMRDGMIKMQEGMMSHMMEHMQAGTGSMAMCPMMNQPGRSARMSAVRRPS